MGVLYGRTQQALSIDGVVKVSRRTGEWQMQASKDSQAIARDVAWKPWDETLASATRQAVFIWRLEATDDGVSRSWRLVQQVPIGEEVWKISWSDIGGMLLVSCGEDQQSLLLKQQLGGQWDVMGLEERGG